MKIALMQLNTSDDPVAQLPNTLALLRDAAVQGAEMVFTPEVTNCVSSSRSCQEKVLQPETEDITLAALRSEARALGVWICIGSLALKTDDRQGRFANRQFLIDPSGDIRARYDKIHMFDVALTPTETYLESAGYRRGSKAVTVETPLACLGLTICYDLRFAYLYRDLAHAGAQILTVPAAFSPVTGDAHWEPLLRARAIETGCFVVAAAQTGQHSAHDGRSRRTHGHSMVVSPWGEVLVDAGTGTGISVLDLDLEEVTKSRKRLPAINHDQVYTGP